MKIFGCVDHFSIVVQEIKKGQKDNNDKNILNT